MVPDPHRLKVLMRYRFNLQLFCLKLIIEQETLLSHFSHLTKRQQRWVLQHFIYGLSNQEIAEINQVSVEKVRSYGRLAMKKYVGAG